MVSVQVMRALTHEHKVLLRRLAQAEEVVAARRAEVKLVAEAIRLLSGDAGTRTSVNPAQHRTGITRDVLTILREAGELLAWDDILQRYVDRTNSSPPSQSSLQRALTTLWHRGVVHMQVAAANPQDHQRPCDLGSYRRQWRLTRLPQAGGGPNADGVGQAEPGQPGAKGGIDAKSGIGQHHARHHATAGNLDRRGNGDIDVLTVAEYRSLSRWRRLVCRLGRNPLILFGLGPAYVFVFKQRLPVGLMGTLREGWVSVMSTNLAIAGFLFAGSLIFGAAAFLVVPLTTLLVAAACAVPGWPCGMSRAGYWCASATPVAEAARIRASNPMALLHPPHGMTTYRSGARIGAEDLCREQGPRPADHDSPAEE